MAEMTMVERVARAIYPDFELAEDFIRREILRCASAAIEAMREPTEEMVDAHVRVACESGAFDGPDERATWRSMIDAALQEPTE